MKSAGQSSAAHCMRSETRRSLPMFPQLQKLACIVGQERCLFLCYYTSTNSWGAVFRLFLVSVLLLRVLACSLSLGSVLLLRVLFYEHQVVALLTNRNRNSNGASEHEHEHRIAPRASNVAPKNTVRRKQTGEALAAAPAQTATVPNPTAHCSHPFSFREKTGAVEL